MLRRAREVARGGAPTHNLPMLEIERLSWLKPRYLVRDDRGSSGEWVRARFKESMAGELGGRRYEFARDGRKRFSLIEGGRVLATADAARRGRWAISVGGSAYELARRSAWRSEMELRAAGEAVGRIHRGRAARGKVVCELPAELPAPVQAFAGLLALTLWNRAAASSSGAASAASSG